jgi:DNA-binding response OmpR family regulator
MRRVANYASDYWGVANMRAVIVEDDEGTRDFLRTLVEMEQWECGYASRFEAVQHEVRDADVVVLDLHLPGIGGLEAVRWMREQGMATPVVLVTGDTDPSVEVLAAALRVDRLLVKPFEVDELLAVLADVGGQTALAR